MFFARKRLGNVLGSSIRRGVTRDSHHTMRSPQALPYHSLQPTINNHLPAQSLFSRGVWRSGQRQRLSDARFFSTDVLTEENVDNCFDENGKYQPLPNENGEKQLALSNEDFKRIKKALTAADKRNGFEIDISDFTMTESRIICSIIELKFNAEVNISKIKLASCHLNHQGSHHICRVALKNGIKLGFEPPSANEESISQECYQMLKQL